MSDMNNDFVDLTMFDGTGEELPGGGLVSAPKPSYKPTPVGDYLSRQRSVKVRTISQGEFAGHLDFEVSLDGGVEDPLTGRIYNKTFPLKKKMSTIPYDGDTKVGEYLRAFGVDGSGMTPMQLVAAVQDTLFTPCLVYVGRSDKRVRDESTGQWTGGDLRTKDFLVGGVYVDEVEKGGVVFKAKEVVSSFKPFKG